MSKSAIHILFSVCLLAFIISLLGDAYNWMENSMCFHYLGCNIGFFGFDALRHYLSGMVEGAGCILLTMHYPSLSFFQKKQWKSIIIVVAFVTLFSVGWELGEYIIDDIRINEFHTNLFHPNHLGQPSNADTMGDLTINLAGGLTVALAAYYLDPKSLQPSRES